MTSSRMKTSFLVLALLSLLPFPSSPSAKHLLLETVDKKNHSDAVVAPIDDSKNKAGSDYMQMYCQYLPGGCKTKVLVIPLESNDEGGYDATRANSICRGSSRHGAPCTT